LSKNQRSQAIEALKISGNSVKCQKCGTAVPIVGKMTRNSNDRIGTLQMRIKWIEGHYNHATKEQDLKEIKQEVDELLE
jgi:hypothetical protein